MSTKPAAAQNPDAKGSVDLIDASLLECTQQTRKLTHATRVGKTVLTSTFDIEPDIDGKAILFRYGGANSAENKEQGIFCGDMRIVPGKFAGAIEIAWRDSPEQKWDMLPVKIERVGAIEGIKTVSNRKVVSRDSALAFFKRADAKARGELRCAACGFDGLPAYGEASDRCFEVHHKYQIAHGERVTDLDDLVIVCANCHNAIHGLGELLFDDFRALFST